MKKYLLYLPYGLALLYFFVSIHLPFWGDAIASVSKPALTIYDNGLFVPWNLPNADPGHPTLFPWLLALCWMLLGKSLWVAHLLVFIFIIALIWLTDKIGKGYLTDNHIFILKMSLLISPLFVSQALGVFLQLPLTVFFLAAYYASIKNKIIIAAILLSAMMLCHLQGVLFLMTFFIFRLWKWFESKSRLNFLQELLLFGLPTFVIALWLYFHKQEFGWALVTPNYMRASSDLKTGIYNFFIGIWRIVDLGYLLVSLFSFLLLIKRIKTKATSNLEKLLVSLSLVFLLVLPFLFAHPPNHRYFLGFFMIAFFVFFKFLQTKSLKYQVNMMVLNLLFLGVGNFMYYPGKCLGDANIVYLNYTNIEEELIKIIGAGHIVYSYAPLNNHSLYTQLSTKSTIDYADLYEEPIEKLPYVLRTNLNCEFTAEDLKRLEKNFQSHDMSVYGINATLYVNNMIRHTIEYQGFGVKREISRFETFLLDIKLWLKGKKSE
jgi:hypothetical protein